MMPKNYMYIDSTGIGVNKAASSTFDISGTLAVSGLMKGSSGLDLSGNINCNDGIISSVDPMLGINGATLTQKFLAYNDQINNVGAVANSNTIAIGAINTNLNSLNFLKVKAYGLVSYTGPQNVMNNQSNVINQKYYTLITSYNINTTDSYYGVTGTDPLTYTRRVGYAYIRLSIADALGFAFVQSEAYTSSVKRLDNLTFEIFLAGGGSQSLPQDWTFYFIVF